MPNRIIQAIIFVYLTALAFNAQSSDMVYKCKNQEGAFKYQKSPCHQDSDTISSWSQLKTSKPENAESATNPKVKPSPVLTLTQNLRGHYFTDATINDKSLNFVIDTGATIVSLPEAIAHSASIYCDNKIGVVTANGTADACTALIKKLQFGPFVIKDVSATIVPHLDQPLLGMNVLQSFKIAQENGEMRISIQN